MWWVPGIWDDVWFLVLQAPFFFFLWGGGEELKPGSSHEMDNCFCPLLRAWGNARRPTQKAGELQPIVPNPKPEARKNPADGEAQAKPMSLSCFAVDPPQTTKNMRTL